MIDDTFWSELYGEEGNKFMGGKSRPNKILDVSIKIALKWFTKLNCGRAIKYGLVYKHKLACLFGMVKGIDFDKATLLVMELMGTQIRKKGDIHGRLYLSYFIKDYYDKVPSILTLNQSHHVHLQSYEGHI